MCSADLHEKLTPGNSWDGNKMKGIESDQENWVFATGLLSVCLDLYLPSPNPLSKSWRAYVCFCVSVCLWSCVITTCPTMLATGDASRSHFLSSAATARLNMLFTPEDVPEDTLGRMDQVH